MSWIALGAAILKFILGELPKFIASYKLYAKDAKYKSQSEKYEAAVKKYKKTKELKDLNELAK